MDAQGLPNKMLHALPEFVNGEALAALKRSVLNQFVNETNAQRCLPSSCVLPRVKVTADIGEKLRRALSLAESVQAMDMKIPITATERSHVYLPALRTQHDDQNEADFHDDFDVDDPQKEATWTALLYLEAASGDRFMVRSRNNPEHVESQEITPGTLILFKSSEVQHTATGITLESRRLALGPVALDASSRDSDAEASADVFRSRILSWGSSSGSTNSNGCNQDTVGIAIAATAAVLTIGTCIA
jgi:hypothetical protein